MALTDVHIRQRQELLETLRAQSEAYAAAAGREAGQQGDFAANLLQGTSDAFNELAGYLGSSTLMDALNAFHDSAAERERASLDLNAYLRETGLTVSDRAMFTLFDNNWCAQAVITVFIDGAETSVGAHYDSDSGFGTGACP